MRFANELEMGLSTATDLNIQDRVERMAEQQAFITLKDHKDNFENKPPADSSTHQKVRWAALATRSLPTSTPPFEPKLHSTNEKLPLRHRLVFQHPR